MKVSCIQVGELRCNCYLIEKNGKCLLVDPGDWYEKILNFIAGKEIEGILITHHHFDHVGCLENLVHDFHYPVYDSNNLFEGKQKIGSFSCEVIYTPGHAKDCISFYFPDDEIMFTGDFLFYRTIGRCDLKDSDIEEMHQSIEKIKQYDDHIVIYPGHGKKTLLGDEKKENSYFS